MSGTPRALLHVVQVTHGESFILEYDNNGRPNTDSLKFMLVDGGPAHTEHYYTGPVVGRPNHNLFNLLNWLSGDLPENLPLNGLLRELETVILTNDDEGHKGGIQELFASLLPKSDQTTYYGNTWLQGSRKVAAGQAPIKHIWYNSLKDLATFQGKPAQVGWFDKLLQQYAGMKLQPQVEAFNDEMANSNPMNNKDDNHVAFAVQGATSKEATGHNLCRGQFIISLIGPDPSTVKSSDFLKVLGNPKPVRSPIPKSNDMTIMKKPNAQESPTNTSKGADSVSLERSILDSVKNASSIAFVAEDSYNKKSMLFLSDTTTTGLYHDYLKSRNVPRHFTLMKVAHHGDYLYNCWPRDQIRKGEENSLSLDRRIEGLSDMQRDTTFFFSKIQADKYLISASGLEKDPYPHEATIIGIIAAAYETKRSIEIYLTNPLAPSVAKAVGKFLHDKQVPSTIFRLYVLVPDASWGTIAIYDHEKDYGWEQLDPEKDLWTTYSSWLYQTFPVLEQLEHRDLLVSPSIATDNGNDIARSESLKTRALLDVRSALQHLVQQGAITLSQANQFEVEASSGVGFYLAPLLSLFIGCKESEAFIASLPCDLGAHTDYLTADSSPSRWLVSQFRAEVVDSPSELHGWTSINSISFKVAPSQGEPLSWKIPFGAASPAQNLNEYYISHDDAISVSITWPAYATRHLSGQFQGALRFSDIQYSVIGCFTKAFHEPLLYSIQLSGASHITEDYQIPMVEMLRTFGCSDFNFGRRLTNLLLPRSQSIRNGTTLSELRDQLHEMNETQPLYNGEFILERVLSKVVLKEVAAALRFDKPQELTPLESVKLPFNISSLRFVVRDLYSIQTRRLMLELSNSAKKELHDDALVPKIPFQLVIGFNLQGSMTYELTISPSNQDPLSIERLLGMVGLSSSLDLKTACPSISNLSNALSISHATIGWTKLSLPDYIMITTQIDDWNLLNDKFMIKGITLDVQARNFSSASPTQVCLHGRGTVKIYGSETSVSLNITRGFSEAEDVAQFQMIDQEKPMSLGEEGSFLPEKFNGILGGSFANHILVRAARDEKGWFITQMHVQIGVGRSLDIIDQVKGTSPALLIDITYPFDKPQRTIHAILNTIIHVDSVPTKVEIILASSNESDLLIGLTSDGQPLTLEVVASHFIPGFSGLSLPSSFSFLLDLAIQKATINMERRNQIISISDMVIKTTSTNQLQLWNDFTLEELSLLFSYSKQVGKRIWFEAKLYFADRADELIFTLNYQSPPATTNRPSEHDQVTVAGAVDWEAIATYKGTLSTVEILSHLSGIDLRQAFESVGLSLLHDVLDIKMSNLEISLTRNSTTTAFFFEADTDWLFFSHLRFTCSKSAAGWSYSFGFDVSEPSKFIKSIPLLDLVLASRVAITDPSLVLFNGALNSKALRPEVKLPKSISRAGINVAFATKIQFLDSLRGLEKATGAPSLVIIGIISDNYTRLSAGIDPISLLGGKMVISGSVVIICSEETNMAPRIGVEGTAILNFGNKISKSPIETSLALLVDTNTAALGFQFTLDKWEAVFGYKGLNFNHVCFQASFPPEEFPIPSTFTIAGAVDLTVNDSRFGGSVSIHGAQTDPASSYATGSIEGLDFNSILRAFSNAKTISEDLNPGFGPLEFKIVPKDLIDNSTGEMLRQQFMMKGSMRIPQVDFEANVQIGITMSKVVVEGHLSPIIILDKNLFSVLASPHENPPPPPSTGATIHIAATDGASPPDLRISGQVTFLGMSNDVYFDASPEGLKFAVERSWAAGGSLTGTMNSKFLTLSGALRIRLETIIPSVQVGSILFRDIRIVDFEAALHVEVMWSAIAWPLRVTGHFHVFQLVLERSFICNSDIQDLSGLTREVISRIKSTFADDFVNGIKALLDQMDQVVLILQQMKVPSRDMAEFLVESCGASVSSVTQALKDVLNLGWEELVGVIQSVGGSASNAVTALKQLKCDPYEIALAIAHVFGSDYKLFCGDLLMKEGFPVEVIARFFKDVFGESTLGVITLLGSLGFGPTSAAKAISAVFGISETKAMILIVPIIIPVTQVQIGVGVGKLLYSGAVKLHSHIAASEDKTHAEPSKPSTVENTEANLHDMLTLTAKEAFVKNFNYEYLGSRTTPPTADTSVRLSTADAMCSYVDGDIKHVSDFVEEVLRKTHPESWNEASIKSSLFEEAKNLTQLPSSNDWQSQKFTATYSSPQESSKFAQINAIFLYVNGLLFQNGHRTTQTVLFYLGVYYHVLPPLQIARKQLKDASYQKAKVFTKDGSEMVNEEQLRNLLGNYTKGIYEEENKYMYNGWSQDLLKTDKPFINVSTRALGYFEDKKTDTVQKFVENGLFSGVSLPVDVAGTIKKDVAQLCQDIVVMMDTVGEWIRMDYEHQYDTTSAISGSIKCKAIILRSSDTRIIEDGTAVSMTQLFFMGVFYEIPPSKSILFSDEVKTLCIKLQGELKEKPSEDSQLTPQMLEGLLERYAARKFEEEFKYTYDADGTKPLDYISGTPVCGVKSFGAFSQVTSKDLEAWVNNKLLRCKEPPFDQIHDTLLSKLKSHLEKKTAATIPDNRWGAAPFFETFKHPIDDNRVLNVAAIVLYTNHSLNKKDNLRLIYYMGVYYSAANVREEEPTSRLPSKPKFGAFLKSKLVGPLTCCIPSGSNNNAN